MDGKKWFSVLLLFLAYLGIFHGFVKLIALWTIVTILADTFLSGAKQSVKIVVIILIISLAIANFFWYYQVGAL